MSEPKKILAITACPTGIAHTYMAAENLQAAAEELGYDIRVETHGSIGVENGFTAEEIEQADAVVIAADKQVDLSRFAGLPLVSTGVSEGIKDPKGLLRRALTAPVASGERVAVGAAERPGAGATIYKALMNGVSHMIPFVVTGGLLIALSLSIGGHPTAKGLVIPEGTFWYALSQVGALGFTLMVPILSGFIAYAIADRPGLAPGMITGYIAITGSLYGSAAGSGFLGGILTGFACGYVALGIKKIPVHKYIQPIMPIIVIPILTSAIVGLFFIYVVGAPIAGFFAFLTQWLGGMQGASVVVLGAVLGAMVGSDMGGPINKTAFLFGGGLIATGNAAPMAMVAAAIAVPPLGMGVATLIRRTWFTPQERESGIAALFMGFFGITEGAIPFAAARPLQVIPANMLGGAVAGALAGVFGAQNHVMHGGPIVAVLGAVDNVPMYFVALIVGSAVTAASALALMGLQRRRSETTEPAAVATPVPVPAAVGAAVGAAAAPADPAPAPAAGSGPAPTPRPARKPLPLRSYLRPGSILLDVTGTDRDALIRTLAERGRATGQIADVEGVVATALAREAQGTTGVGQGIAIPHAKTDAVDSPFIGFARVADGTDWHAMDGAPATLVFLIGVPQAAAGDEHLRILAALSRALMKKPVRQGLESAGSPEQVLQVLESVIR